ncbi:MAG: HEAT repeat domain-containing protein [Armatimonadetes bacterium]|nr:HEAT repeat domain-containing protein [Armatimonadota bacterium]
MEGQRRPTRWILFGVVILGLIAWLTVRYLHKRSLVRDLGSTDMQVRVDAASKLLEMGKLGDALPAQHIIVRSKTAEALGEIGTDDALDVLADIIRDSEDAPRRWARHALAKQGKRAMPILLGALSAGGATRDEAIQAMIEIGPETAQEVRFFISDGSSRNGSAEALARIGGVGTGALVRACYNAHGSLRDAALNNLGLERSEAVVEPALYNLLPISGSRKGAAIKALGLVGDRVATPEIIPFLEDVDNREAAVTSLGQIGDPRAVEPILATLTETEKQYRYAAILALRRIGRPAFPALVRELNSSKVLMRRAAAQALIGSSSSQVNVALTAALWDTDVQVRAAAASALGWQGNVSAVPALVSALSDDAWEVVDAAVEALGEIGVDAVQPLLAIVGQPDRDVTVRYQISRALVAIGRPAVDQLTLALASGNAAVQKWVAVALGEIGDPRAVEAMENLAESGNPEVRWVVQEQLRRLESLSGT